MSADSTRPPEPAAGSSHIKMACPVCGEKVTKVRTQSLDWVVVEGRDDNGAWWAVKIRGEWRVTKPQAGEDPPSSGVRYREHDCAEFAEAAATVAAVMAKVPVTVRQVTGSTTMGPCTSNCGAWTKLYGVDASPLCLDCREVLARWRKSPGPHRGPVPFGRMVDGVYVQRDAPKP